jgi:Transposase DDE domain
LRKTRRHPGTSSAIKQRRDFGNAYRKQRGHIAEIPHGHIRHNMGLRQLSMRGNRKASAEWKFACAVHNLFKAISTGHLSSEALSALAS